MKVNEFINTQLPKLDGQVTKKIIFTHEGYPARLIQAIDPFGCTVTELYVNGSFVGSYDTLTLDQVFNQLTADPTFIEEAQ